MSTLRQVASSGPSKDYDDLRRHIYEYASSVEQST